MNDGYAHIGLWLTIAFWVLVGMAVLGVWKAYEILYWLLFR